MSKKIFITSEDNPKRYYDRAFVGDARTYSFDFSQWAEENNNVTAVTFEVVAGSAGITGETLASNVATALITTSEITGVLIKITATTGTEIYVAYLDIIVKDPKTQFNDDYGLRGGW